MVKHVILGFLMYKDLTGYDIKQIMVQSTSNFMNASFGSIYPALNNLEKNNLINSEKVIDNGKYKKVYKINEDGKKAFLQWLEGPLDFMKSYENILAKIFLYGHLPKEKSYQLIEQMLIGINEKVIELEKLEEKIKGVESIYEISTLHFGIDHLKFMHSWYSRFLKDLDEK